jgi:hypothetical protein
VFSNASTCELNDAELQGVAGGMDCDRATMIAGVYQAAAICSNAGGDRESGAYYNGVASGLKEGACNK